MWKLVTAMAVVFSLSAVALAQNAEAQAKAGQILKQARAAIGDESKLRTLQSLSASVTSRRTIGETPLESEIEYEILLPDKFRRSDSTQPFTTVTVVEDDRISTSRIPMTSVDGGSNSGMRSGRGGNIDPQMQARREAAQRADFTRIMLGWLLTTPSFMPVEYSYAGEAREPGGSAEMIDVKGRNGFTVRLFIDQKTHRLVMLTWRGKQFSQVMRMVGRPPSGPSALPDPRPPQDDRKLTPEEQEKRRQEMEAEMVKWRKEFREAMAKAPEVEYRWAFGDYKNVKGINLPCRLVKSEAGSEFEEWKISRFTINPRLTADRFELKEKP